MGRKRYTFRLKPHLAGFLEEEAASQKTTYRFGRNKAINSLLEEVLQYRKEKQKPQAS